MAVGISAGGSTLGVPVLAVTAGTVVTTFAAQLGTAAVSDKSEGALLLSALRAGVTAGWLSLILLCAVMALRRWAARRADGWLPPWCGAILLTALTIPRFWPSLGDAIVAAFWLAALVTGGALTLSATAARRSTRAYWLGCAVFIAPWGACSQTPAWP